MVLSDGDRIRNLLGRYCELIDAGDFDGVGELFAAGAIVDDRDRELARVAAAVAAFYASTTRRHDDGTPLTKHVVANTVLEEPTGAGEVTARSSFVVLQAAPGLPLQPIITGHYVDRFALDDTQQWRFAERRFHVQQVGDLSHHLAFELRGPSPGDSQGTS